MNRLLIQVPIPPHHRERALAHCAKWYSWSPEARRYIERNKPVLKALAAPAFANVRGCYPYDSSYTYRLAALPDSLRDFGLETAEALLRIRTEKTLRYLTGMIEPPLSSPIMHKLFALIRTCAANLIGDARAALHAPVKTERVDKGFPLHFDLFLTDRLLLIFDDVPPGGRGKALFLSGCDYKAAVTNNHLMQPRTKQRLLELLAGAAHADTFDEWYQLVYLSDDLGVASLRKAMKMSSLAIKLRRGEGYLLNDRHWLHGRTAINGRISTKRFHRLIFGRPLPRVLTQN